MCTCNGEAFIREQLDSILAQSHPIDELVIQDDCSEDNTYLIVCEYARKYPFIVPTRNEVRKGINSNFFSAIRRATGDYIAVSDQDDIWEPRKIELQLKYIGNKLLCSGHSKPFSADGLPVRFDERIPNYNLLRLVFVGSLPGHTLFLSKKLLSLLPDVSGITGVRCYDVILSMTAAAFNSIVYVDEVLVHHRRYMDAATYTRPTDNRMNIPNIWRHLSYTFRLHKELNPEIKRRLSVMREFLAQIDSGEPVLPDALRMIDLYVGASFFSNFKLSLFFVKHQDKVFYTATRSIRSALRAVYFPVSCSEYYRHLSKDYRK